ncbi:MAG: phosphate-starvation-inducible PsiE family protein [Pseudomonadota bacterium]|jgi:protein PsiE|nr:phosphate-starvation-inducible PsiE family protein [Xanthomonadaceae bacterium]MDE2247571.1 phosphate-starvation-inducible PsiE family protein [Xanthomonadaceae bacterium]MDE3210215.1 phosphate-starvation-inducible PsiE family protein [Pseudomonadota bacterium]
MRTAFIGRSFSVIERIGLLTILVATLLIGYHEVRRMIESGQANVSDLLLLFMYVEVISMVEVYWSAGKLPVRMPLYIAMVALARHMLIEQGVPALDLLGTALAILLLAVSVVVVRYGHLKLPYRDAIDERHLS